MFPSSVEEGKLWPKAMAGVVRPARVPTPRAGFRQRCPSLSKEGELFLVLMSPYIVFTFPHPSGERGEGECQTTRLASFPSLAPSSAGLELHKREALRYGPLASALPNRSA